MHKTRIAIISLLMFALLTGCGLEQKSFAQFYEEDLGEVTKIVITDGNTGYEKTIEEKSKIKSLIEQMKDVQFIPDENQEQRDGFNYAISLFEKEERIFQFGLTKVNDHYYHTKPDLYPIIDQFYKELKGDKE